MGDFDANGRGDILWYGPDGPDGLWYHDRAGGVERASASIDDIGDRPASGDFDGGAGDDLLFHQPGRATDHLWFRR